MKTDLFIKNGIIIPASEIEIATSRAGGPGGQYVNKTDSRVTIRWNAKSTHALDSIQKERLINALQSRLTNAGDLIIHSSSSRSQQRNKEMALERLAQEIRKALYVPQKRKKTKIPASITESRLRAKKHRSFLKKMRTTSDE